MWQAVNVGSVVPVFKIPPSGGFLNKPQLFSTNKKLLIIFFLYLVVPLLVGLWGLRHFSPCVRPCTCIFFYKKPENPSLEKF